MTALPTLAPDSDTLLIISISGKVSGLESPIEVGLAEANVRHKQAHQKKEE